MSLTGVFNRGLDGLTVAQRGLATASNNIANINTKGYARQEIVVGSREVDPTQAGLGGGSRVIALRAIVEPFVEMQLRELANDFGTVDGRRKTVNQMEALFSEGDSGGLSKAMNEYFNAWSELSNSPASIPMRQAVRDRGILLAQTFNRLSTQLSSMRRDLSNEVDTRLETINDLMDQVATLNQTIVNQGGTDANPDLVVKRNYLIRQLSEEIPITSYEQSNGAIDIQLDGGGTLVSSFTSGSFSIDTDDLGAGGDLTISLSSALSGSISDVTAHLSTGRLGGNMVDRNTTLNTIIDDLDTLAYELSTQINAQHQDGYGLDSSTLNNFFTPLASSTSAAANISVDAGIIADVRTIASASQDPSVSGVADNRNALTLAGLQTSLTMSTSSATFSQYYSGVVGSVGSTVNQVNRNYDTQSYLINQMEVQRESISGVNLDEEGASIIQYQRAFQAASKLMSIADQLMDDLLSI